MKLALSIICAIVALSFVALVFLFIEYYKNRRKENDVFVQIKCGGLRKSQILYSRVLPIRKKVGKEDSAEYVIVGYNVHYYVGDKSGRLDFYSTKVFNTEDAAIAFMEKQLDVVY